MLHYPLFLVLKAIVQALDKAEALEKPRQRQGKTGFSAVGYADWKRRYG